MLFQFQFPNITVNKYTNDGSASNFGAFSALAFDKIEIVTKRSFGIRRIYIHVNENRFEMTLSQDEFIHERYTFSDFPKECGLYFYCFEILIGERTLFTSSINNRDFSFSESKESAKAFELLLYDEAYEAPNSFKGKIMYHVFVDRFYRGSHETELRSDAVIIPDWDTSLPEFSEKRGGNIKNNGFFGGTLYGIIEKLDYFSSLSVDYLYLSPIFKAYSNHKYDTGDYMQVDEMFGGNQALDLLISEAKKRNIRLIFDGVFNHTGDDSKYFNRYGKYPDKGAYQSKDSEFFDWYSFKSFPDDYECWWGIKILPKLNLKNEELLNYLLGDDGVVDKYIKKGFFGVRLDVADELSDEFLEKLRERVKYDNSEAVIIGEVWENAANKISYGKLRKYFLGKQLDSVMNYPWKEAIIDFVKHGDSETLYNRITELYFSYPKFVSDCLMNILGTHDTERILSVLGDAPQNLTPTEESRYRLSDSSRALAIRRLRCAAVLQFTLPGVPCIYYGDEIGTEGLHDPFCRMPFNWSRVDDDIFKFYKKLSQIRKAEPAFFNSELKILLHENGVFAYSRADILVIVNAGNNAFHTEFKSLSIWKEQALNLFESVYEEEIDVLPLSTKIYKLK